MKLLIRFWVKNHYISGKNHKTSGWKNTTLLGFTNFLDQKLPLMGFTTMMGKKGCNTILKIFTYYNSG